ncbi:MAG TPA: redoxin domain-containing protein [Bryobacteraceae bacterium]|nr:redoxin domain-containing protein [Bryobacteraceae bacterium]
MKANLLPLLFLFLLEPATAQNVVREVRTAIARDDFAGAEVLVRRYRAEKGDTPEALAALSWLGRGALEAKKTDEAEVHAAEVLRVGESLLKSRALDTDRYLPVALGAAIETQAQVMAARGERSGAVEFLNRALDRYRGTSIRTRIQKNIHLLSLEGKSAPPLETAVWLGPKPESFDQLKGRPVLLFFWAHWCGDCKGQAPVLARLIKEYGPRGLALVGPTQRYGYVARGMEVTPEVELNYIDDVRRRFYAELSEMPVPVGEESFRNYGASTTPTLVLLDRHGIVRLYHPGEMSYQELAPKVEAIVGKPSS